MHVNFVTWINRDRGKNVYGARVQSSDVNSSVAKDGEEAFVCGTCAVMIGRLEIKGECGCVSYTYSATVAR